MSSIRIIACPTCKRKIELLTEKAFEFDIGTCKYCWISIYSKDKDLVWLRYEKKNRRFKNVGPLIFAVGFPFAMSFLMTGLGDSVPHELIDKVLSKIKNSHLE